MKVTAKLGCDGKISSSPSSWTRVSPHSGSTHKILLEEGRAILSEDKGEIDARLLFYFWRDVNLLLVRPLC